MEWIKKNWKLVLLILAIVSLFGFGFFIGRKTIKVPTTPTVIYVPQPTVQDSTDTPPTPISEKIDSANFIKDCIASGKFYDLFPEKIVYRDSIEYRDSLIYLTNDDYKKIAMDWGTERTYKETAFDSDTLGKFDYTAKVQYNQLMSFAYEFTPMQKQVTTTQNQIKRFSPFIGAGISTLPSAELDLGLIIDDSWGFSASGRYNFRYEQMGLNKFDFGLKIIKKF